MAKMTVDLCDIVYEKLLAAKKFPPGADKEIIEHIKSNKKLAAYIMGVLAEEFVKDF